MCNQNQQYQRSDASIIWHTKKFRGILKKWELVVWPTFDQQRQSGSNQQASHDSVWRQETQVVSVHKRCWFIHSWSREILILWRWFKWSNRDTTRIAALVIIKCLKATGIQAVAPLFLYPLMTNYVQKQQQKQIQNREMKWQYSKTFGFTSLAFSSRYRSID